jgi:GTP-binding protein HflX
MQRQLDGWKPGDQPRAWLVLPMKSGGRPLATREQEAGRLCRTLGLVVCGTTVATVRRESPATLIGSGQCDIVQRSLKEHTIELVVVDCSLSPRQQRNLEKKWQCKVLDRTGLILEIFAMRARTREGKLQVELAQKLYQSSRLVRAWTHLERQRGGMGSTGGPGETQMEADKRMLRTAIGGIRRELEEVVRTRGLHRESRQKIPYPVVALVGYTNAGKSTLFNRLTDADTLAEDKLFATLDPTLRRWVLPSRREVVLADTVGFIADLPTSLVAAFRATLEEVEAADIIIHVRDASDPMVALQGEDVMGVLAKLDISPETYSRMIELHHKIDALGELEFVSEIVPMDSPGIGPARVVRASSITGEGLDALADAVESLLAAKEHRYRLRVAMDKTQDLAWLHAHGTVHGIDWDEEALCHWVDVSLSLTSEGRARGRGLLLPQEH